MAKRMIVAGLALSVVVAGAALARVEHAVVARSGSVLSASAGKELRSSVGLPIATATLRPAAGQGGREYPDGQGRSVQPGAGDAPVAGLRPSFPNPFNPETTITYAVGEPARVFLGVYDVSGKLVRTLVDDVRDPGRIHEARWNGKNDTGDGLPSGVYFLRITTDSLTATEKVVLLK